MRMVGNLYIGITLPVFSKITQNLENITTWEYLRTDDKCKILKKRFFLSFGFDHSFQVETHTLKRQAVWTVASFCLPSTFMHKHFMMMMMVVVVMIFVVMMIMVVSFLSIHANVAKPSSLPFSLGNATTNKSEQTESQRSQQGLLCFICRHNSALQTKQRKAEEAFKPLHCSFFSFLSLVLPSIHSNVATQPNLRQQ